jgi:hypothetical protein
MVEYPAFNRKVVGSNPTGIILGVPMSLLYVDLTYPHDHPENFKLNTNIKESLVSSFLIKYFLSILGKKSEAIQSTTSFNDLPVYHVRLELNLRNDHFRLTSDCGNDSLAVGILLNFIRVYDCCLKTKGIEPEN